MASVPAFTYLVQRGKNNAFDWRCEVPALGFGKKLVVDCLGLLGSGVGFKQADKHRDRGFNP